MYYLIEHFGVFNGWLLGGVSIFLRYSLLAGSLFLVFYVIKRRTFLKKKIQQKFPNRSKVLFEIKNSFFTALIFAVFGLAIYFLRLKGFTEIYLDISSYGWGYLVFSFFLLIFIHDTWFYWMHRLIHLPGLFQKIHRVHHQSHNPTPWAALSFHPTEAVLEILFLPLVVMIIPFHPLVLVAFSAWSLVFNVLGHLGFEMFPSGFTKHRFFRWFNTATHHNMHHQQANCNFGLYFNFWDTMMKTNHWQYHQFFEEIQREK